MEQRCSSLLDQATHWPVRFRREQVIYDDHELSDAIYRVEDGCVRLQVNGPDGSRQIIRFLFPGDLFGLSLGRRSTAAEAVTDSEVTRFPLQSVREISARSPELALELFNEVGRLFHDLAHHMENVVHRPANERVMRFFDLIAKLETNGTGHGAPMSGKDIADYLGLTPETLSRSLKVLRAQGLIPQGPRASARSPRLDPPAP